MTPALEVELETKRPRRLGRGTVAAVFGAVVAVPMAATGAEAYVPDDTGAPSPSASNETTSADAAERNAAPEPAPPTPPKPAPEPIQKAPEPAPDPEPAPAPKAVDPGPADPKPNEHQALRDVEPEPEPAPEPQRAPEPTPAPEDVKPNEHEALRDLEPAGPPAPEDVKPNEHEALRDMGAPPVDDEPRGDGDGPLPPYGGLRPEVWVHLPEEDRQAIREQQQREEDEAQLDEWGQNPPDYVAMGDSYAAGTGTLGDDDDPPGQRTEDAYGPEIAEARSYDVEHVAFGGATTENVLNGQDGEAPQVDALDASTDVVTLSIGGNDANFGDVVAACGDPRNGDEDCFDSIDEAQGIIEDELPGRLDEVYSEVSTRAPEAEVIVVGYPRMWDSETDDDSDDRAGFTPAEIDELNETADILAITIGEQARAYDFEYVDPRTTFDGHGVGSDEEYLNGLDVDTDLSWSTSPVSVSVHPNSFHPNEAGYDALGELVVEELED